MTDERGWMWKRKVLCRFVTEKGDREGFVTNERGKRGVCDGKGDREGFVTEKGDREGFVTNES